MPIAATAAAASSDAARGMTDELAAGSSSLAARPGAVRVRAVPDVTISGLPVPASAAPRDSMTRRSSSQLSWYLEKS